MGCGVPHCRWLVALGLWLVVFSRAAGQSLPTPPPDIPPRMELLPQSENAPAIDFRVAPSTPVMETPTVGEYVLPEYPVGPAAVPWTAPRGCPHCQPWMSIYQGSSYGATCNCPDRYPPGFGFDAMARAYYFNDQRIKWTGLEDTFGVEGVFSPRYVHRNDDWIVSANSVLYLNQPYDRNILIDAQTASYANNWMVDIFQIWQLNLRVQYGDWTFTIGKDNTPFGRYYFPVFSNPHIDAPFIRSEAIRWNETGIFLKYAPSIFVFDVALTNGGFDRDTNSSKALVTRGGIDTGNFAAGVSAKLQDGIGSEFQKIANSHIGVDAMVRWGSFDLSSEVIYDQYGFFKNTNPNTMFYGRSIYYRDVYGGRDNKGVFGVGYYVNLGWTAPRLRLDLNYGEYYPLNNVNVFHDDPIRRGMLKGTFLALDHMEAYTAIAIENNRPVEAFRAAQSGFMLLTGAQMFY